MCDNNDLTRQICDKNAEWFISSFQLGDVTDSTESVELVNINGGFLLAQAAVTDLVKSVELYY